MWKVFQHGVILSEAAHTERMSVPLGSLGEAEEVVAALTPTPVSLWVTLALHCPWA